MSNGARKILSACIRGVDVMELYSPERINKVCHEFGLRKGSSLDLRTGWNFEEESHRRAAWERVHQDDPMFITGSPPCTMFSVLQCMNPSIKGADQEAVAGFREQLGKARQHVEFCCKLYEYQLKRGAHFVHEHPWGARSWDMECVTKLIHNEDVMIAMVDQCRFGLETSGEDGSTGPARKRTGFMSSSWTVIEELDGACNGLHKRHNHLIDGRAKGAEVYPPELCRAICRGVARQKAIDEAGAYSSAPMSERQLSTLMNSRSGRTTYMKRRVDTIE